MDKDKAQSRRNFIDKGMRITLGLSLAGVGSVALSRVSAKKWVWQIDPFLCTQCGRCADYCVLKPSAVKCVHAYDLCGYCDLCGGYLRPEHTERDTGAENQLCPTAAIERRYIEEPYYEYVINRDLCIGCAKCVAGCTAFGNGSLHLQIQHDLCMNCNECSIARVCPSNAISRVESDAAYIIKGGFTREESGG
ncbi:MAG: ferredoxin [Bacteroidales bacterium]|nr:ferredoxin [Bacteroidales bacterium]